MATRERLKGGASEGQRAAKRIRAQPPCPPHASPSRQRFQIDIQTMAGEMHFMEAQLRVATGDPAGTADGPTNMYQSGSDEGSDTAEQPEPKRRELEQRLTAATRTNLELQAVNDGLHDATKKYEQQNDELRKLLAASAVAEMAGGASFHSPRTTAAAPPANDIPTAPTPDGVFVRRDEILSLINERDRLKHQSMAVTAERAAYKTQYDELFQTIMMLKTRNEELREKLLCNVPQILAGPPSPATQEGANAPYGYAEGAIRLMPSLASN